MATNDPHPLPTLRPCSFKVILTLIKSSFLQQFYNGLIVFRFCSFQCEIRSIMLSTTQPNSFDVELDFQFFNLDCLAENTSRRQRLIGVLDRSVNVTSLNISYLFDLNILEFTTVFYSKQRLFFVTVLLLGQKSLEF